MYKITEIHYSVYEELAADLSNLYDTGFEVVQVLDDIVAGEAIDCNHIAFVLLKNRDEQDRQSKIMEDCKNKADEVQKEFDSLFKQRQEIKDAINPKLDKFIKDKFVSYFLKEMTPDERMDLFHEYCLGCGGDLPCYCMKDE